MTKSTSPHISVEPPPQFVAPQFPAAESNPPDGEGWIHEIKQDGWRIMARIEGGSVRLLSRDKNDWTQSFALVANELTRLPVQNAYLDGEIIVPKQLEKDGFFTTSAGDVPSAIKWNQPGIHYSIFDLLFLNGEDLRPRPLLERKMRLYELLKKSGPHLHYHEHYDHPGAAMIEHACRLGAEGIVSKRAAAGYRSGRPRDWLKVKCRNEQEFVIIGYTGTTFLRSLVVGYYDGNQLKAAGKIRHGFTNEERRELFGIMRQLPEAPALNDPKKQYLGTRWVKPSVVIQASYLDWKPGRTLNQASYVTTRMDKKPHEVVREDTHAALPNAKSKQPRRGRTLKMPAP